jgi:ABC-type multidrug transport system fused ATPase/permease subunit
LPELEPYVVSEPHIDDIEGGLESPGCQPGSITMKNCSFSWTNHEAKLAPIDGGNDKKKGKKERRGSGNSAKVSISSGKGGSSSVGSADEEVLVDVKTLRNISVQIHAGELIGVIGTVGSGKSSFLSAILGEMEPMNGSRVYIPKSDDQRNESNFMAYCSQTPWVVNDTLKGNVLFGE